MFTDKHRFFIQFMLTNGTVPLDKAKIFFEELGPDENSLIHLKSLIIEINREISNHSFKIASSTCEITGEKVFVWLNTKNDDLSRHQLGFTPVELEYFHALMQEIVSSEDHRILYPRCINISSTLTGTLSRENGEKALSKWIKGGYFVKKDENVYLGIRTILEFTTYLRTNTENCTCDLCSELVFVGETCHNCAKPFHSYCFEKYFQNHHSCPSCKVEWQPTNTNPGTELDSEDEDLSQRPGPSRRVR